MIRRIVTSISLLLLLLVGIVGCGGGDADSGGEVSSSTEELPDGAELISKMEEAINGLNNAHYNAAFQLSTDDGQLEGTMEVWQEGSNNRRYEFTSPSDVVNGLIIGSNETQYWAYSPKLNAFYVSSDVFGSPFLPGESEARSVLRLIDRIQAEGGLSETLNAATQGAEQINSRDTYQVETTFKDPGEAEVSLEGVSLLFWVDQESFLPQQVQLKVEEQGVSGRGTVILQGEIQQDEAFDASLFSFEPEGDTATVNMDEMDTLEIVPPEGQDDQPLPPAPSE